MTALAIRGATTIEDGDAWPAGTDVRLQIDDTAAGHATPCDGDRWLVASKRLVLTKGVGWGLESTAGALLVINPPKFALVSCGLNVVSLIAARNSFAAIQGFGQQKMAKQALAQIQDGPVDLAQLCRQAHSQLSLLEAFPSLVSAAINAVGVQQAAGNPASISCLYGVVFGLFVAYLVVNSACREARLIEQANQETFAAACAAHQDNYHKGWEDEQPRELEASQRRIAALAGGCFGKSQVAVLICRLAPAAGAALGLLAMLRDSDPTPLTCAALAAAVVGGTEVGNGLAFAADHGFGRAFDTIAAVRKNRAWRLPW